MPALRLVEELAAHFVSDLIAFCEARISEDEASAKAAASVAGPHWRHDTGWSKADHPYSQVRSPGGAIVADALRGPDDEEIGPFLARHDPARVLREVTAKRAILTRHSPVTGPGRGTRCGGEFDVPWPCEDARSVAAIWSGHPDYQEGWKP